jgi:hypothetical protein
MEERMRKEARRRVIAGLLAGTAVRPDIETEDMAATARLAARHAWWRRLIDDYFAAVQVCDAAWMKLVEPFADWPEDEEIPEVGPPPEQAEVDRLYALLSDVRDRDRWPRHLHWSL